MEYKNSAKIIILPLLVAVSVIVGMFIGKFYKVGTTEENRYIIYPKSDKLSNVVSYVAREYVDEVNKSNLIEETIPKILEDLDPHSQYIPAEDLQKVNEPLVGNFSGIGVQFNMLNDTMIVIKTIANGPSEKMGILAGDRFIMVDGDSVAGVKMPSDSIVRKLKGPRGTKVNVGVLRRGFDELIYFDLTRDNIPLYSIDISYMIRPSTGYIKISKFSSTTYQEFIESLGSLKRAGMQKLILDLRGNGGGYLNAAVNIADQFLQQNDLIVYTEGKARERFDYRASKGGYWLNEDIIVLIDEGSASASEILAGAIQDNDRGMVIGRRSFGKGLVQEQKGFADGSAVRLTIARYYTPAGRSIQKPYDEGSDEYYSEIAERYAHGELLEKDSINFADSLKYKTRSGRTVYGGGGIMPDIFVPIDTIGYTDYLGNLRGRGILYRYALTYTDKHRKELEVLKTPEEIITYLDKQNALQSLINEGKRNDVYPENGEIQESKNILRIEFYAYVARNLLDNEGFYPIIEKIDNTLEVALKELE